MSPTRKDKPHARGIRLRVGIKSCSASITHPPLPSCTFRPALGALALPGQRAPRRQRLRGGYGPRCRSDLCGGSGCVLRCMVCVRSGVGYDARYLPVGSLSRDFVHACPWISSFAWIYPMADCMSGSRPPTLAPPQPAPPPSGVRASTGGWLRSCPQVPRRTGVNKGGVYCSISALRHGLPLENV